MTSYRVTGSRRWAYLVGRLCRCRSNHMSGHGMSGGGRRMSRYVTFYGPTHTHFTVRYGTFYGPTHFTVRYGTFYGPTHAHFTVRCLLLTDCRVVHKYNFSPIQSLLALELQLPHFSLPTRSSVGRLAGHSCAQHCRRPRLGMHLGHSQRSSQL